MNVEFLKEDQGVILGGISGPINGLDKLQNENLLGEIADRSKLEKDVVLDFAKVESIDSSGVSWLIQCHKRFSESNHKFVIHSLQPIVKNVLTMMRLDKILYIAANRDAAMHLVQGGV